MQLLKLMAAARPAVQTPGRGGKGGGPERSDSCAFKPVTL